MLKPTVVFSPLRHAVPALTAAAWVQGYFFELQPHGEQRGNDLGTIPLRSKGPTEMRVCSNCYHFFFLMLRVITVIFRFTKHYF